MKYYIPTRDMHSLHGMRTLHVCIIVYTHIVLLLLLKVGKSNKHIIY